MHTAFACVGVVHMCMFVSMWAHVCLGKCMGVNAYGSHGLMLAVFLSDSPPRSLKQGVTEASAHDY